MEDLYEDCREHIEELAKWYSSRQDNRNEATTRLHLINALFLECLGWSKDDIIAEESLDGEYTDYTFLAPRRVLIVEAKREGDYFELPVGTIQIDHSIPLLCKDYPNVKKAIEQVSKYCQKRGVIFATVCNGHQLISFIACRNDGIAPLEGRALVFESFEIMIKYFRILWDSLSKTGIEEKKLYSLLIGEKTTRIPAKLSASISNYPGIKGRNIFQTDLQILSELVIEDVAKSADLEGIFLKECYCQAGALSQHSILAKQILQTRYAALFEEDISSPTIISATEKNGITPELIAESISRRPIVLLGDMGVGKTTFIRNLIKVEAVEIFKNGISLYIDLGTRGILSMDLRQFILDEIIKQLREKYDIDIYERNFVYGIYNIEIQLFQKSIYGDLLKTDKDAFKQREIAFLEEKMKKRDEHIKYSLQHITRGQQKQVVIFLDNADQRIEDIQENAFLIAQEMGESWPVTVFLALRPTTFHRSLRTGSLSGYHPKAFVISPPRVDRVLEKRLEFCIKIASGDIPLESIVKRVGMKLHALEKIMRSFLESLKQTNGLVEFIDNISGGNIRLALDLVRQFFGSGHVDTQKIVDIYDKSGSYYVPLHEFLRAVIYGDNFHYDPMRSYISNIFDVSMPDIKEHFLVSILIEFLYIEGPKSKQEGFIEISRIYNKLQELGFTPDQIDQAIIRCVKNNLIVTGGRKLPDIKDPIPEVLRATSIGVYHVLRLSKQFSYIDAIIVDTPIMDKTVRENINDVSSLDKRLERAEIFKSYLDEQWKVLNYVGPEFDWEKISVELQENIDFIREHIF